jgi:hypothetical protein
MFMDEAALETSQARFADFDFPRESLIERVQKSVKAPRSQFRL